MTTSESLAGARRAVRWTAQHWAPRTALTLSARAGDATAAAILTGVPMVGTVGTTAPTTVPASEDERIRAHGRLVRGRLAYMTASYDVSHEVLRRDDFGSGNELAAYPRPLRALVRWSRSSVALAPNDPPSLLVKDPPDHGRYRRLVGSVFTPRAIEGLRHRIESICAELLDELSAAAEPNRAPVDLVRVYSNKLPATLIGEVLGIPTSERDILLQYGLAGAPSAEFGLSWRQYRVVDSTIRQFNIWIAGHLERLERSPGDNLMSRLVTAEDDHGRLTEVELRSLAGLLLAAGFITTTAMLTTGAHLLMTNPDQLAVLRDDPTLWPNAVDEILRLETPVQRFGRNLEARDGARRRPTRARGARGRVPRRGQPRPNGVP